MTTIDALRLGACLGLAVILGITLARHEWGQVACAAVGLAAWLIVFLLAADRKGTHRG